MKKLSLVFFILLFSHNIFSQNTDKMYIDTINSYFEEVKLATKKHSSLWAMDIYGPLILINPDTREIYANEPDSIGLLTKNGSVYAGILPDNLNFANTAIDWGGKRWAMVMLPLSEDRYERVNLLSHELYHVVQPKLGFNLFNASNNHLDQKEGRIYLRLELEALEKSIFSNDRAERKKHLTNAFIFRKYRNILYPQSSVSENKLELNEGIAEYTGQVISGRNKEQAASYLDKSFDKFMSSPTYVRLFPYYTTPAYGFLLKAKNKNWNKQISAETNLTDYFIKEFGIILPQNLDEAVAKTKDLYNGTQIIEEEAKREANRLRLIAEYKKIFIEESHLILPLEKMSISFDTNNIVPLEGTGSVYPTASVVDNWGKLSVDNGMLMSSNWKTIYLSKPLEMTNNKITGEGWSISLNNGYKVVRDGQNYILTKE